MRVMWLKYGELLPVDTGGKLRSYHLLRQLQEHVDLTFVSYADRRHTPGYPARIAEELPGSRFIAAGDLPGWRERSVRPVLTSLRTGAPLNVTRFTSGEVSRQVAEWLEREHFDLLLCDFLTPSLCLPAPLPVPLILFEHNVESALWARRARTIHWPLRPLYEWEAHATLRWERRMLKAAELVLAVSEEDRAALGEIAPEARISIVETGVDVAAFEAPDGVVRSEDLIVFLGSMDWQPNQDGVTWFVREIWPQVRRTHPKARFRVVGRRPSPAILALQGDGVEVTGDVPSVVPHLAEATVSVVPLRAGGGTRLKIFEAMAAGTCVVSTTIGAEGLPVRHGSDVLLADAPGEMADAISRVLNDRVLRTDLAEAGLATARQHDWSRVAGRLVEALEGHLLGPLARPVRA